MVVFRAKREKQRQQRRGADGTVAAAAGRSAVAEDRALPSTCWRWLRDWEEQGVWLKIWRTFLGELNERRQIPWSESFLEAVLL